jgi:hypothetical protein
LPLSPTLQPKYKSYAFFTLGLMDILCNWCKFTTDVTKLVRRIKTFTIHGEHNSSTKNTMLLFFLIFKLTMYKLTQHTLVHKQKQILTIECAIREDKDAYYREPPTFT